VFAGEHSLMQDPADEDAARVRPVNDDVPLVLNLGGNIHQIEPGQLRELVSWQVSGSALRPGAQSHSITNLAENVPLGNSALLACQNGGTQCFELCLVFLFGLFKRPQACAENFARVGVVASLDPALYKFVHLGCQVDIASWHGSPPLQSA